MKTKTVEYYVDLYPGWDQQPAQPYFSEPKFVSERPSYAHRFKIVIDLPLIELEHEGELVARVEGEVK